MQTGTCIHSCLLQWLHRGLPRYEAENIRIAEEIEKIHEQYPDKGYGRITDDLKRYHGI